MNKKFFIIGLGSMGKRRIRNLLHHAVAKKNIVGFDLSTERANAVSVEYGIKTVREFEPAVASFQPDALIISTPPDTHAPYFLFAARHKINFFVEVPTTDAGYAELMPLLDGTFVAAPSCTFRYYPAVRKLKELISQNVIGRVLVFQQYLGQYLPDWHPFEDYRRVYFAQEDTGGAREMFFYELVWLTDLFGASVATMDGRRKKVSALEMMAEDVYACAVVLENNAVGTILIDLLNRRAERTLKIIGSDGTIDWNWIGREIRIFSAATRSTEIIILSEGQKVGKYNTTEEAYQEELGDFLAAVDGTKPFPYSFTEDLAILKNFSRLGQ